MGIFNKLLRIIIYVYIKYYRNLYFSVVLKIDFGICIIFIIFIKYFLKFLIYILIKFFEFFFGYGWVIFFVYFGNVITFDILNFIYCKIFRKRNLIVLRNFNLNIYLFIR